MQLNIGTLFTYSSRKNVVCKITGFTFKSSDERGPIGITYLPWRGTSWASMTWSLSSGNLRHIIASPVGLPHYGEQIDWDSFKFIDDKKEEILLCLTDLNII